jgi:hypothetical protein
MELTSKAIPLLRTKCTGHRYLPTMCTGLGCWNGRTTLLPAVGVSLGIGGPGTAADAGRGLVHPGKGVSLAHGWAAR